MAAGCNAKRWSARLTYRRDGCGLLPGAPRTIAALPLLKQRLADPRKLAALRLVDLREMQIEPFERADDRRADHDAGEPFVVGRHDVPWRQARRGVADQVLVGRHVARPQRALADVVHRELPVFRRLLQPAEKALALLFFGDVEEEFQNHDAVAREVALDG